MKKLIIAAAFSLSALTAFATSQPIANGPSVLTTAVLTVTAPSYTGQVVVCSDCANQNVGKGTICLSSGTATGAWIVACSSNAATTACR